MMRPRKGLQYGLSAVTALCLGATLLETQAGPNGFTLNHLKIPKDAIKAGGPPKDGIPALTDPDRISADQADYLNRDDIVVGVALDGEAVAYPLKILVWHEIVNDRVGDRPIVVSYCPLCGSSLVFRRDVNGDVREFGVSGLLYKSNVLMYDRQPNDQKESLWSQVMMKAVAGPAARKGLTLDLLPATQTSWKAWRAKHPDTQVLSRDTGYNRNYGGNPYKGYFENQNLMFPAKPQRANPANLEKKDLVVWVRAGAAQKAYPVKFVVEKAGKDGFVEDQLGSTTIRLHPAADGRSVEVEKAEGDKETELATAYLFWFSLASKGGDVPVWQP